VVRVAHIHVAGLCVRVSLSWPTHNTDWRTYATAIVARAQLGLPSDNVTLDLGGSLMDHTQLKLAPQLPTAHLHPGSITGSSAPHHCNCFSVLCW